LGDDDCLPVNEVSWQRSFQRFQQQASILSALMKQGEGMED